MTQEEKAAIDYAKERLSMDDYPCYNDEYEIILAFEEGAKWQKEQIIKWLKENKEHSFIGCEDPCLSGYLTDEFIEELRKAMEEQQ